MSEAHLQPMWDKGVKPKWLQGKPLAWGENPGLPYSGPRNKTLRAWLSKEDNKLGGKNTPHDPFIIKKKIILKTK